MTSHVVSEGGLTYFFNYRVHCYKKLREWGHMDNRRESSLFILAELLGAEDTDSFKDNPTEREQNLMKALAGPHGYTIYKMLLANNKTSNIPVKK